MLRRGRADHPPDGPVAARAGQAQQLRGERAATGEDEERYVVLSGVSEGHLDAIDHVLERHGLTIAAFPAAGGTPRLLGATTPDVVHAFHGVHRLGAGDAGRLADLLGWTVERAADALQSLALRRLIQAAGGTFRPLAPA